MLSYKFMIPANINPLLIPSYLSNKYSYTHLELEQTDLEETPDITLEDMINWIKNSKMTDEEKQYFLKEDYLYYFEVVLDYVNQGGEFPKQVFRLQNEHPLIIPYNQENYPRRHGYVMVGQPFIFVANYKGKPEHYDGTIDHEKSHCCEIGYRYNLINEACAEIESCEFFPNQDIDSYYNPTKLIRILMEIIGSESIMWYHHTGDFSKIETCVKPYLTDEDYERFLECLSFNTEPKNDSERKENEKKFEDFQDIMRVLYYNVFGDSMKNNEIIDAILNNRKVKRWYFNPKAKQNEKSYYLADVLKKVPVTFSEVIDDGTLSVEIRKELAVNKEDAEKISNSETTVWMYLYSRLLESNSKLRPESIKDSYYEERLTNICYINATCSNGVYTFYYDNLQTNDYKEVLSYLQNNENDYDVVICNVHNLDNGNNVYFYSDVDFDGDFSSLVPENDIIILRDKIGYFRYSIRYSQTISKMESLNDCLQSKDFISITYSWNNNQVTVHKIGEIERNGSEVDDLNLEGSTLSVDRLVQEMVIIEPVPEYTSAYNPSNIGTTSIKK